MRHPTLLRLLTLPALFLFAITTVTVVAIPAAFGNALAIPGRSDGLSPAQPVSHMRRSDVRQSFLGPQGWHINYITFTHMMPIQLAVVGLQDLYQSVAVSAFTHQLTNTPPSNALFLQFGAFELTLTSNGVIPWAWLHAFALNMFTVSGAGFTPGYTIDFLGPSGTTFLRASLKVSSEWGGSLKGKRSAPKSK